MARVKWILLGGTLLVLLLSAWQGYHMAVVAHHLTNAQTTLQDAKDAIDSRDVPKAKAALANAGSDTKKAAHAAKDPLWSLLNHTPFIGGTLATAQTLTTSADEIARIILPPTLDAAGSLDGKDLRNADGAINYQRIANARPALTKAAQAMHRQVAKVARTHARIGFLQHKRNDFLAQIADIDTTLTKAEQVSERLPAMLGASGTRRYFVGFLTNAEARATGGFLGAYGILKTDDGHLSFEKFGTALPDLHNSRKPVVDFGQGFKDRYAFAKVAQTWSESTIDPHFPEVGAIWVGLWKAQTGQQLDGAIQTDPVGLSHLLAVTGPVQTTSGEVVDSTNVVRLVENEVYLRAGDGDQTQRKTFLLDVAAQASRAIIGQAKDSGGLIDALKAAAKDNRIRVFASNATEEQMLLGTPVSGELPKRGRPLAYVVIQNGAGNKIDYYLDRAVTYQPEGCGKPAVITVRLANTLKDAAGLPQYVVGHAATAARDYPLGTAVLVTSVYIDGHAQVRKATVDGVPADVRQVSEHGLFGLTRTIEVPPGATKTLRLTIDNDPSGTPRIVDQPLVRPEHDQVLRAPSC